MASEKTLALLRSRLCNLVSSTPPLYRPQILITGTNQNPNYPLFYQSPSFSRTQINGLRFRNLSKLKFLISNSISEACNNSVLLLGPRGCGKSAVVDLVLGDVKVEHPDMISVVRLNGLLHNDDNCALKEIARQLCFEHQLLFSRVASSDDNAQFMMDMLRECGLAHKTVIFVLEEFDLFTQGKQRLLYSLLDALQTLTSQAVVIGVSCRLDADQLLEKRVRSRFSHRKLLFVPPTIEDAIRLMEYLLYLPKDQGFPSSYIAEFNLRLQNIFGDKGFKEILFSLTNVDGTISSLLRFLVVNYIDMQSGLLSLENFKNALLGTQRQPKSDNLQDVSILELYMLVCMNRLEIKEQNSYNFISVMKEYKAIHDAYKTSDNYAHTVCLRAFEHLLERELISFSDPRARSQSIEYRPVKLLIPPSELYRGLKSNAFCPAILQKLLDHESCK